MDFIFPHGQAYAEKMLHDTHLHIQKEKIPGFLSIASG